MNNLRMPIFKILSAVLLAMAACVILLTATACIPRSVIQKQSEASAEYFVGRDGFPVLFGNGVNAIQDNYSDTVLCNIIYCIDPAHPFTSAVRAGYVGTGSAGEGYLAAVRGEQEVDTEYGRYWHGTMVLLRPLLTVMPIQWIRVLFGTAGTLIQLMLIAALWRNDRRAAAVCYGAAFLLVHPWIFFVSLEYGTAFLTASAAELFFWLRLKDRPDESLMPFFAVVGVVTFFADFLTTETMTFTLPMFLLILWRSGHGLQKGGSVRENCVSVVKNGGCWLFGYAAMFLLKLLFLLMVAGGRVAASSLEEGMFRIGGVVREANFSTAAEVGAAERLSGAIWHNLACLFPTQTGKMEAAGAWIPSLLILGIGLAAVYLLHDRIDWERFAPLWLLALIPYLRFLALSNHAYIHFFITYRAQMVSLAVFLLFVYENGVIQLITKRGGKKR